MSMTSPSSLRDHVAVLVAKYRPDKAAVFLGDCPAGIDNDSMPEQLKAVNRYWRRQLGLLPVPTHEERSFLMDECNVVDWLRHFEVQVMPLVVEYGLPTP